MNPNSKFKGTGVAIVTPFLDNDQIDFNALANLIEHLIKGKVNYIVALGTTGETPVLSDSEKLEIVNVVKNTINGRIPLVVGMSGNYTAHLIDKINKTDFSGIDAVLSVCPYYNKPNSEGVFKHFEAVATASPVPVIAYNVPGRTGGGINAATTLRMAHELSNIIGIKEASGNISHIMEIIKDKPKDFLVISGDDALTLPIIAAGGDGVISVVANAFPQLYSDMVSLCLQGNFEAARKIHYQLLEITNAFFADGSPGGVKVALNTLGICANNLRLPLTPVNMQLNSKIRTLTEEITKSEHCCCK